MLKETAFISHGLPASSSALCSRAVTMSSATLLAAMCTLSQLGHGLSLCPWPCGTAEESPNCPLCGKISYTTDAFQGAVSPCIMQRAAYLFT